MGNLRFDHSIEAFMPKSEPAYMDYEKARETFGDNSRYLIMAVSHENLWSHEALSCGPNKMSSDRGEEFNAVIS
ncbi:MAG: hypothetical protein K9J79_02005 [Desulfobacteraceae bacterium]|nr:hypothetical protein [Desulfobacteraceae bacterium]